MNGYDDRLIIKRHRKIKEFLDIQSIAKKDRFILKKSKN